MEILKAIQSKRAVRSYTDHQVPSDVIHQILEAGMRAQSSRNQLAWCLIVIQSRQRLQDLADTGKHAAHLASSSLSIAIATPNPIANPSLLFDAGQVAAYLQLAALEFGLGSCLVKLHDFERAGRLLSLPPDYQVNFAIAFGYPLDPASVTALSGKRGRPELAQRVCWEEWQGD